MHTSVVKNETGETMAAVGRCGLRSNCIWLANSPSKSKLGLSPKNVLRILCIYVRT